MKGAGGGRVRVGSSANSRVRVTVRRSRRDSHVTLSTFNPVTFGGGLPPRPHPFLLGIRDATILDLGVYGSNVRADGSSWSSCAASQARHL